MGRASVIQGAPLTHQPDSRSVGGGCAYFVPRFVAKTMPDVEKRLSCAFLGQREPSSPDTFCQESAFLADAE